MGSDHIHGAVNDSKEEKARVKEYWADYQRAVRGLKISHLYESVDLPNVDPSLGYDEGTRGLGVLLPMLLEAQVDLYLCGHLHVVRAQPLEAPDSGDGRRPWGGV